MVVKYLFIILIIHNFEVSSVLNVRTTISDEKFFRQKRQSSFVGYGSLCPFPVLPKFGLRSCTTQSSSYRECTGRCLPGYAFSGGESEVTLWCTDGIWRPQSFFPPCESLSMCELEHRGKSSYNCTLGTSWTRCDITCNGVYEGQYECSSPRRQWRPPLPRCIRANIAVCGEPEIVGGSSFNCTMGMQGTVCDIICDGIPEGRHQCYPGTSEWTTSLPPCVRAKANPNKVYCEEPEVPENGRTLFRTEARHSPGSVLRYVCNEGYEMLGAGSIKCFMTGQWSTPPPYCQPTENVEQCEEPPVPENGRILYRSNGNSPGSQLRYACAEGYEMDVDDTVFCTENGEWSAPPPHCLRKTEMAECENPGPISNGRFLPSNAAADRRLPPDEEPYFYPERTSLVYSCEPPYVLQGNQTINCTSTERWSSDPPTCVEDCGRSSQTAHRIHNGYKTEEGEWPWMVAISLEKGPFKCGGILVNRRTVLTAAHCIDRTLRYILHFGKFNFSNSRDDDRVLVSRSTQLIVHPNYKSDPGSHEYDIALIKFFPTVRYTDRIQPICLPTTATTKFNLKTDMYGYLTGWGHIETRVEPDELLMAILPVQSHEKCVRTYGENIRPGMFCAGRDKVNSRGETSSACTGDSGSGLVFVQPSGRHTVEGIVSFSRYEWCGVPEKYTVFTKVSDYVSWIRTRLK